MNLGFSPIVLSKSLIQNTEFSHLMVIGQQLNLLPNGIRNESVLW